MKAARDTNPNYGRLPQGEKISMMMQDAENPLMYQPEDMTGNRFFGQMSRVTGLGNSLFVERRQKLTNYYAAQSQAQSEIEARPVCFGKCITDMGTGLDSVEKNCIRDCYLKHQAVREDWQMYMMQQQASAMSKLARESMV